MSYLNSFRCVKCGKIFSLLENALKCDECGHLLMAEFDIYKARKELYQKEFGGGDSLWKYGDFLPVDSREQKVSLGEGNIRPNLIKKMSHTDSMNLYIKNEGLNPSGSIRDREMSVLFSAKRDRMGKGVLISGTPNSCISAAAYAAHLGIPCFAVLPNTVPMHFLGELNSYGARVLLYNPIDHNREEIEEKILEKYDVFKIDETAYSYRLEGAKTILFELWEFLGYQLPDYIFLPLGEGITLVGIWKGLMELKQLGWIQPPLPHVVAVQSSYNAPVAQAMLDVVPEEAEEQESVGVELNVNSPAEMEFLVAIIKEEKWEVIALDDETILKIQKQIAQNEGILISPEGSATIGAYWSLKNQIKKQNNHTIVFINPVHGFKYIQSIGFLKN